MRRSSAQTQTDKLIRRTHPMYTYPCTCGNRLFFNNTVCISCTSEVGWCEQCRTVSPLQLSAPIELPFKESSILSQPPSVASTGATATLTKPMVPAAPAVATYQCGNPKCHAT